MPNLQPKKFQFTLVIRDVITKVLANSPDGWLKTKITYKPDSFYKGLRRSLTTPYTYVKEAAYLLRKEWYTYGALSKASLIIEKLIAETWIYGQIYKGKIDFTTGEDIQSGFNADTATDDFTVQFDAYDEVKYLIPLEGDDILDITLPPLTLKESCDFIMLPSIDFRSNAFFAMQVVNYQQNATEASVQDAGFVAQVGPDFTTTGEWFFRPRLATKVRIFGGMGISVNSGNYQLNVYRSSTGAIAKTIWEGTFTVTTQQNFDFDFVLDVAQFETLSLYFLHVGDPNTNVGINMQYGQVSLEYNTISPESKCKGIRAFDVFKRLLQLMNTVSPNSPNQPVPCQSYLLDKNLNGVFKNLIYTCSDSIRAGNTTSSVIGTIYQAGDDLQAGGRYLVLGSYIIYNGIQRDINTFFDFVLGQSSFSSPDGNGFAKQIASTPSLIMAFKTDLFQDVLALQGGQAALGIENGKVYLEDWAYCFRPGSGGLNVGIVDTTTKITAATDLQYNSFKGGYKDQEYDKINGLSEVNSEVTYVTDLLNPAKELNIQASSRSDPTGIEIARVTGVDTASSRSDNDNFMIIIKDEPEIDGSYKPVQMDALASFSGVDVSYYNWFISPKQNLLRGGRYLRSIFDKMDGYSIRLSAPLKNVSMITIDDSGRRVGESDPVMISAALGSQMFIPWYIEIKAGLPLNTTDLLDIAPFSDIACTWNDVLIKGFSAETNVDEGENSAQNFKLLLTPENKTVDLIR